MPDELDAYLNPLPKPRRGNYDEIINRHSQRTGLDPELVRALVHQESGGNPRAVSPKGARGVMQLMPATAKRFGVTDPFDPEQAIRGGTDYLKFLNDRFKGNRDLVLAGYNAGEGAVDKFKGIPPYRETQNYVKSINARLGRRSQQSQKPVSDLDLYLDPVSTEQSQPPTSTANTTATSPTSGQQAAPSIVSEMERVGIIQRADSTETTPSRTPFGSRSVSTTARHARQPAQPPRNPLMERFGQQRTIDQLQREQEQAARTDAQRELESRRLRLTGPGGMMTIPSGAGLLNMVTNPIGSVQDLFKSDDEQVNEMTAENLRRQKIAQDPEVTESRKLYGRMSPSQRVAERTFEKGGAQILKFGGGLASGFGIAPNRLSEWMNRRGELIETAASMAPIAEEESLTSLITGEKQLKDVDVGTAEKIATGVTDLGLGLGQIMLLKRATNLSFPNLLALEAAAKNSDKPASEQAARAAEGYALGQGLERLTSRAANAALSGIPTAAQTGYEVSQGRMSPLDAAIQTGIQTGVGAILPPAKPRRGTVEAEPATPSLGERIAQRNAETLPPEIAEAAKRYTELSDEMVRLNNEYSDATRNNLSESEVDALLRRHRELVLRQRPLEAQITDAGYKINPIGEVVKEGEVFPSVREMGMERNLDESQIQTKSPAEAQREQIGRSVSEGNAVAGNVRPESELQNVGQVGEAARGNAIEPSVPPEGATPQRFYHRDYGEVSESPNQRRVGKGRIRVVAEDGSEHVVKRPTGTGAGNQRAVPVRTASPQNVGEAGGVNEASLPPSPESVTEPVAISREPSTTAVKNAALAEDRAALDLPELAQSQPRKAAEVHQRAIEANSQNPRAVDLLTERALQGGKNFTDVETAQLRLRAQEIKNRVNELNREIESTDDAATIQSKRVELDTLTNEFDRLSEGVRLAGTEWGRAGVARQQPIDQDFNLVSMKARLKADKGAPLTERENAQIEDLDRRLRAAEQRASEAEQRVREQESTAAVDKYVSEQQVKVRSRGKRTREQLLTERSALKSELSALIEAPSLKAFLKNEKGEFDPEKAGELSRILRDLARNYIEDGVLKADELATKVHEHVRDVTDLTKREVSDLISGYGTIRKSASNPVERKLNEIKSILAATSGKADVLEESMRPLRRGQQREKPTEDQRRVLRELNEAMWERGPELARDPYDSTTQQATPLDKAKTTTRNRIEQLQRWISEGKRETESRTEIIPDTELKQLRAERDALEQVARTLQDPKADDRAIEQRVRALEQSLAETRQRIQSGQTQPKSRAGAKQPWSEEIGRLTKEREALNSILADMRAEARRQAKLAEQPSEFYGQEMSWAEFEKQAARELGRRRELDKQAADLERRLRESDFTEPAKREPPKYTRETLARTKEVETLKAEYEKMRYRASTSTGQKALDELAKAANVPKTIKSIGDISAILRQGGFYAISHPITGGVRPFREMVKSFSEVGYRNVEQMIKSDSDYETLKKAGVEFTGVDKDNPKLSAREEGFLGGEYLDYVPVAKQVKDFSERTFVSFLDAQRLFRGKQILAGLTDAQRKDSRELKAIAQLINAGTGRGNLGKRGNQAAPLLNIALFSPRLLASRVQLLNNMVNPVRIARMPPGARKEMIKDNVKFISATFAALALAKGLGATVSTDPDDSEFLKIRIGNTTYDTLTGLQQPLRYILNMVRAATQGETYPGESKSELSKKFARSKLSPIASVATNFIADEDYVGRKFSLPREARDLVTPLPAKDIIEGFQSEGLIGSVKATPTLIGIGVGSYPPAADKPTTHAEKLARKLMREGMPDEAREEEQITMDRQKAQLRARSRAGENVLPEVKQLVKDGKITEQQAKLVMQARGRTRLSEDLKRLDPAEAMRVYSVMNADEKRVSAATVRQKIMNSKADAAKKRAFRQRARELGLIQ